MPASDTFARLGLIGAVTVVVGISTLGPMLRQGPQPEGRLVALAAVIPPPAPLAVDRSTGFAAADPASAPPTSVQSVPPASTPAAAATAPSLYRTSLAAFTLQEPAPAVKGNAQASAAAPIVGTTPSESSSTSAFPSVQTLDEVPTGQTEAQAAQAAAAALAAKKAKRAAELRAAARKKAAARPQPFDIRDFFAGRL